MPLLYFSTCPGPSLKWWWAPIALRQPSLCSTRVVVAEHPIFGQVRGVFKVEFSRRFMNSVVDSYRAVPAGNLWAAAQKLPEIEIGVHLRWCSVVERGMGSFIVVAADPGSDDLSRL